MLSEYVANKGRDERPAGLHSTTDIYGLNGIDVLAARRSAALLQPTLYT
jgi:hypothetical protein